MSIARRLLLLGVAALIPCGSTATELISIKPDPVTGRMVKTRYTKYYDAGVWMLEDRVGLSLVVDQQSEERGDVTAYVWNRDMDPHTVKFLTISIHGRPMKLDKTELLAVADDRSGLLVGSAEVLNFATAIKIDVSYELDGNAAQLSLQLDRRTREELKKYFGKNGKPPYPWYQD